MKYNKDIKTIDHHGFMEIAQECPWRTGRGDCYAQCYSADAYHNAGEIPVELNRDVCNEGMCAIVFWLQKLNILQVIK